MKKRLLSILMVAVLALSLTACGSSSDSSESGESTEESESSEAKTYKIGICQLVEHEALDAATQGFKDALTELCGEGNVEFDEQNAQNEHNMCATIINQFVSDNVDLILANATDPLTTAATATSDIPIIGTSVTDFSSALQIEDMGEATGINVSGTSDLAPIDEQEAMLKELVPDVKSVGILYCSAESNSKFQADLFKKAAEEDGLTCKEYVVADSNEIQSVVTSAVSEVEAIYVPTDNTIASNTEIIKNVCVPAGIPVFAGEEGICRGCGVATLTISGYYNIGHRAGEMAYEVLANGADISTMPIEFDTDVTKKYNPEICEELGITVPDDYVALETEE